MENIKIDRNQALVVLDAMEGFTSRGTFGKAFGKQDSKPIDKAFERLQEFIDINNSVFETRCLIKSVYSEGKFTSDWKSPLYRLCAEGSEDLKDAIRLKGEWFTVQKAENDATKEPGFTRWIGQSVIEGGKNGVILTGCTLTTCVRQTAMAMRQILNNANQERTSIITPLNLIGSRESHTRRGRDGKSRMDLAVEEMKDYGIRVIDSL